MNTRVKFFMDNSLSDLEKKVNNFIEKSDIDIVDLKLAVTNHAAVCSIVYGVDKDI